MTKSELVRKRNKTLLVVFPGEMGRCWSLDSLLFCFSVMNRKEVHSVKTVTARERNHSGMTSGRGKFRTTQHLKWFPRSYCGQWHKKEAHEVILLPPTMPGFSSPPVFASARHCQHQRRPSLRTRLWSTRLDQRHHPNPDNSVWHVGNPLIRHGRSVWTTAIS